METRDALLSAIAKARGWIDDLVQGRVTSFAEIAAREGKVERHVRSLALLAFISPRIVATIIDGSAPADLTVTELAKSLPHSWAEQERRLGLHRPADRLAGRGGVAQRTRLGRRPPVDGRPARPATVADRRVDERQGLEPQGVLHRGLRPAPHGGCRARRHHLGDHLEPRRPRQPDGGRRPDRRRPALNLRRCTQRSATEVLRHPSATRACAFHIDE